MMKKIISINVLYQGRDSRHDNETVFHDTYAEKNVENMCSYIFQDSYFFILFQQQVV
jgi:hypothetical protein